MAVWSEVSRVWQYEHAVVLLVMGRVSQAALAAYCEVQFREDWGWCTLFNALDCREPRPWVPLPSNSTEFSLPAFTLDKLGSTATVQRSFYSLIEFLDVAQDIRDRIRVARDTINQNLVRWLREGWLLPARRWPLFAPPPANGELGEDEVFDQGTNTVLRVDRSLRTTNLAKGVLELSRVRVV